MLHEYELFQPVERLCHTEITRTFREKCTLLSTHTRQLLLATRRRRQKRSYRLLPDRQLPFPHSPPSRPSLPPRTVKLNWNAYSSFPGWNFPPKWKERFIEVCEQPCSVLFKKVGNILIFWSFSLKAWLIPKNCRILVTAQYFARFKQIFVSWKVLLQSDANRKYTQYAL